MKKTRLVIIVSLIVCAMLGTGIFFVVQHVQQNKINQYVQDIDYSENTQQILNPDQGFYRTAQIDVTEEGVEDKTYIIKDDFQMYHLRMDISAFSGVVNNQHDKQLSQQSLQGIENTIKVFYNNQKNLILRFAYDKDFDGNVDFEPNEQMIYTHIGQLCEVLNKYPQTITAIEAGMVGPWGEMHTSKKANPQIISKIIDEFLTCTTNIPVLVRTPKMIYDYLSVSQQQFLNQGFGQNKKAQRLGLFNDGFLGSETDLGTYTDRQTEIQAISKHLSYLPYGGEVVRPSSSLHDIDKCLPEMFDINLSYLNYEWNDQIVQQKWKQQLYTNSCGNDQNYFGKTAYEYINNHLGYRLILEKSTFYYSAKFDNLNARLQIKNVGFGNFYKQKQIEVLFVKNNQIEKTIDIGNYNGEQNIVFECDISNLNGEYQIYIRIASKSAQNKCMYAVQFANNLWHNDLSANLIGGININK